MKIKSLLVVYFLMQNLNGQVSNLITHVDKSGVQIGSNNKMTVVNKSFINNFQAKKYNKIWIDAVQKTFDEKNKIDLRRFDSIQNLLLNILHQVQNIPKALEIAKDSLRDRHVTIDENKFNQLNQEVFLLNKDGDFIKYGDEFVFNPLPTIKKGELAFESDFITAPLVPIKKNNNYGYINSKGVLVIPYSYDYASRFNENVAVAKKNMKWIAIDTNNKKIVEIADADTLFPCNNMLIPYLYFSDVYMYNLKDNSSSLYLASIDGFYGVFGEEKTSKQDSFTFFAKNNRLLANSVVPFFFGGKILLPSWKNEKYFVLDYNGNTLDSIDYDTVSLSLSTGILSVRDRHSWGYYDLKMKEEIIAPRYKSAENFIGGYAIVITFKNEYGIIDRNNHSHVNFGDWKIQRTNDNLLKFSRVNSRSSKKNNTFITDASLNCIQGNCMTTD